MRTVEYVADEQGNNSTQIISSSSNDFNKIFFISLGFHPSLSHPVQDTKAVQLATQRHFHLYNKIAERNSDPNYALNVAQPKDTAAVGKQFDISIKKFNYLNNSIILLKYLEYAKEKHLSLFEKIAAEHAKIGEEQLAARLAFEATSIRNEEEDQHRYQ